jgi:hypothetical protein
MKAICAAPNAEFASISTIARKNSILLTAEGVSMDKREAGAARAEMDRNCNSCADLKRVPHPKDPHGFLQGCCMHNPFGHMFVMKFHPNDPMQMRCWRQRPTTSGDEKK